MRILFIVSGNHGAVSPVAKNQGDALVRASAELEYYMIRGKGLRGYLKNVRPLRQYLRSHQYDAIHAHYSLTAFVASLAGARPLTVSLMGSDVKASKRYKTLIRLFAKLFRWRNIIVKSRDMYDSLGMPEAVIIPNGVDMDRFRPMDKLECRAHLGWDEPDSIHVLFPADPSRPEKDFALAQSAVALLKESVGKSVCLHVFERVPNEETPYHYNAADVVLMTSKWEGSPNAIKEAMACGCPIVSTDVGDVRERLTLSPSFTDIHPHSPSNTSLLPGCFVAEGREPKELAALLQQALSFGQRTEGRQLIIDAGLTNDVVAEKLMEIYQKVLTR